MEREIVEWVEIEISCTMEDEEEEDILELRASLAVVHVNLKNGAKSTMMVKAISLMTNIYA
ncbi:hypothetical protein ACLOJK_031341 [Asimina triloba]